MVHILIHGVTTLELILCSSAVAEHHRLGMSFLVLDYSAVLIAYYRCVRTAYALDFIVSVFSILVNAEGLEAIYAAERLVELHTCLVITVAAGEVLVHELETALVHFRDNVLVVCECYVDVKTEFAELDESIAVDVELPSGVLHLAYVRS